MLDFRTQSQLLDATASIARAYFTASANTLAASAGNGWALWSEVLKSANLQPTVAGIRLPLLSQAWWFGPNLKFWAPLGGWDTTAPNYLAPQSGTHGTKFATPAATAAQALAHRPELALANYRSSGGHAVSQVIVPAVEIAEAAATVAFSPMQTMFGVWRAALRM